MDQIKYSDPILTEDQLHDTLQRIQPMRLTSRTPPHAYRCPSGPCQPYYKTYPYQLTTPST
jgi:hypothetical protein